MAMLSRRTVLAGIASLPAARGTRADDTTSSPLARGALAQNPLARAFENAPRDMPGITLVGPKKEYTLADFAGRTILMPLWAEWCGPCLSEIPDFARLQKRFGNSKFAIVPVLSGTRRKMTAEALGQILTYLHADVFEPLIEYRLGDRLVREMARRGNSYALPCNLLIGPDGRCVGRELGMKQDEGESASTEGASKSNMISRAEGGEILSLWGKPAGEEFASAMANGFLE